MRRNRLITILLCMTLTISAFTGCGKKDTVAEAEPEAQTEKNYVNSTEFVVEPTETAAETETEEAAEIEKTDKKDTETTEKTDTNADSAAEAGTAEEAAQAPAEGTYSNVTLIGDSVMLGAADNISSSMPGCIVDAKESRQVKAGVESPRGLSSREI